MNLSAEHLAAVRSILSRHVSDLEVRAFGSRVTGASRPASDLDLVVIAPEPLPVIVLARLRGDFAESDLPFRVDVADYARLPAGLREAIGAASEVVQLPQSVA